MQKSKTEEVVVTSAPQFHKQESFDAAEYQTLLAGPWELEYRQLSPGHFTASNTGFVLGESIVYQETFNCAVSVYGALQPGLLGFSIPNDVARSQGRWWGAQCPPCSISFATGGREIDVSFTGGYRNVLILLPEQSFREHYRNYTGEEADFLDHAFPHLSMKPAALSNCEARWNRLISSSDIRSLPQDFVISTMVETLASRVQKALSSSSRPCTRLRSGVVRDTLELWRNSKFELSIAELSRLARVSQRTLEHAFRDHYGLTPYQYLKRCRLGLARDALSQADPICTTVTEVALCYGFSELGRFAGEYRRFFGEQPSETLARRARPKTKLFLPKAVSC